MSMMMMMMILGTPHYREYTQSMASTISSLQLSEFAEIYRSERHVLKLFA